MGTHTPDGDDEDLPELGQNAIPGQLGEALVEVAMLQLGQLYERRAGLDFGIDGVIQLTTTGTGPRPTGREIGVQVKRGLSIVRATRYGFTHYCTEAHANYWLRHTLPIIIVHSDPVTERLRWQHIRADTLRRTSHGYAIDLSPESDLRTSLDALRALAEGKLPDTANLERTLILPCSWQHGVRVGDPELGLAALEFSRAALRGISCRVTVEMEEEPDLVASIDAIRDVKEPTAEARRNAIMHEDMLHRLRKHAGRLQRALILMITERALAELFGYGDQLLAEAIRRLGAPNGALRERGEIKLDGWPGYGMEHPIIKFFVPGSAMEEFYARNSGNRVYIRMGSAGSNCIGDLHPDVVATRFLPELATALVAFADEQNIPDEQVLAKFDAPPSMWLMGLA